MTGHEENGGHKINPSDEEGPNHDTFYRGVRIKTCPHRNISKCYSQCTDW